jgi:hypothetical protein
VINGNSQNCVCLVGKAFPYPRSSISHPSRVPDVFLFVFRPSEGFVRFSSGIRFLIILALILLTPLVIALCIPDSPPVIPHVYPIDISSRSPPALFPCKPDNLGLQDPWSRPFMYTVEEGHASNQNVTITVACFVLSHRSDSRFSDGL